MSAEGGTGAAMPVLDNGGLDLVDNGEMDLDQNSNIGGDYLSLTDLPEIAMRHILGYLTFWDLLDLHMVSKSCMKIVESLDSRFRRWTFYNYNFIHRIKQDRSEKPEFFYESNKDIKIMFTDKFDKKEQELLHRIGHRVVDLTLHLNGFQLVPSICRNGMQRVKNLRTYGDKESVLCIPLQALKTVENLQVITLEDLSIGHLKSAKFSLPHLKEISLFNVTGFDGLPNLLSSCSASLEELELTEMDVDFETLKSIDVTPQKLKSLIFRGIEVKGFFTLISMVSSSLEELDLSSVHDRKARINPETSDLCFPKLKDLKVHDCSDKLLFILKCSTPNLKNVSLRGHNGTNLVNIDYDISSIASLALSYDFDYVIRLPGVTDKGSDLLKIVQKAAPNVQEMDLNGLRYKFDSVVPDFPNLKKLKMSNCHRDFPIRTDSGANGVLKIIEKAAPNLQEMNLKSLKCEFTSVVPDFPNLKKLELSKCHQNLETDLVSHSPNLKKLKLFDLSLDTKDKSQLSESVEELVLDFCFNIMKRDDDSEDSDTPPEMEYVQSYQEFKDEEDSQDGEDFEKDESIQGFVDFPDDTDYIIVNSFEDEEENVENMESSSTEDDGNIEDDGNNQDDGNIENDVNSEDDGNIEDGGNIQDDRNSEVDDNIEDDGNIQDDGNNQDDGNIEDDENIQGDENIQDDGNIENDGNIEDDGNNQDDGNIQDVGILQALANFQYRIQNRQKEDKFQGLHDHIAMFSTGLKHLSINRLSLKSWKPMNFGLGNLSKLTLKSCGISSGFHNLLQACQTTLEDLELYDCLKIVIDQADFEMRALKRILIECKSSGREQDITRLSYVHLLVSRCSSLERLALGLPAKMMTSDLNKLKSCHLPNLKIVQVYPSPKTHLIVKLLEDTFPENVTFWFFPVPDASQYRRHI